MELIILILIIITVSCAPQLPIDKFVPILRYEYDGVKADGSYQWNYETGNGISAKEEGYLSNVGTETEEKEVSGSYEYTTDDGTKIQVTYIANKDGFQPRISYLPNYIPSANPVSVTDPPSEDDEDQFQQNSILLSINGDDSILQLSKKS